MLARSPSTGKGILPRKIIGIQNFQPDVVVAAQGKIGKYYYLHVGMSRQESSTRGRAKSAWDPVEWWVRVPNNGLKRGCYLKLICGLAFKAATQVKGWHNKWCKTRFLKNFYLFIFGCVGSSQLRAGPLQLQRVGGYPRPRCAGPLTVAAPLAAEHGLQASWLQQLWLVRSRVQAQ